MLGHATGVAGAGLVVLLALLLYAASLRAEAGRLRAKLDEAEQRAAVQEAQARFEARARTIGERRDLAIAKAMENAHEAIQQVETAPDLGAALVRYRDGLGRVRASGGAGEAHVDADRSRPGGGG